MMISSIDSSMPPRVPGALTRQTGQPGPLVCIQCSRVARACGSRGCRSHVESAASSLTPRSASAPNPTLGTFRRALDPVLRLSFRLVDTTAALQVLVVGQLAGRLLRPALLLIYLPSHLSHCSFL